MLVVLQQKAFFRLDRGLSWKTIQGGWQHHVSFMKVFAKQQVVVMAGKVAYQLLQRLKI